MRMRKKKWAEPFLEENGHFIIDNPSNYRGNWKKELGKSELHVEIGCGKGDYFIGMSALYPETAWVAVEKDRNVAAVAAKKAMDEASESCRMIAKDAEEIETWFAKGEIDVLHLNFSDPWSKNGYRKRRLSHQSFLDKYRVMLSGKGRVILKTDNKTLFEFSLKEFVQFNWLIEDVWVDFRAEIHDEDVITEYEKKFMELGQPIYRAIFSPK